MLHNIHDPEWRERFQQRQQSPVDAVATHLPSLNKACRDDGGGKGLARGWFVTVGANPGFGKSATALNLAAMAQMMGEAVGYISLEMTDTQIGSRFFAILNEQPVKDLERGSFDWKTWETVDADSQGLAPLLVPEDPGGDWENVSGLVKQAWDAGCRWFVVDYLQLIQVGDEESINRAITCITTDLRAWARQAPATVVVLSQFNRQTSSNFKDTPRMSGLWGGMILEASSDMVLLLDHSRYKREGHLARTWLIIDKNRHGPVGEIPILWNYTTLRQREGEIDEEDEWPTK